MSDSREWDFPNVATEPGSAAYYVVRFSPPGQHHQLARWFAWFAHIDEIAAKATDPGVARLKLDWWRDEARNMLSGQARHPLAQALAPQVTSEAQVTQMARALQAVERRILRQQPRTLADFQSHGSDQFASRLQLLCAWHEHEPSIEAMGRHIATTARLAQLGADLRDDYLALPAELLAQFNMSTDELLGAKNPEALDKLANTLFDAIGPLDRSDLQRMARQAPLRPAVRYAAQSLRLQRLLQKHRFDTHRLHRVTPIGLLWSAWRMR